MKKLPPKNVHKIIPRVCATCVSIVTGVGYFECSRGVVEFDTGDGEVWFTTCDRWVNADKNGEQPR